MPIDSQVLGFGNRWYGEAAAEAELVTLPSGRRIRVVRPPWLVATKVEAFLDRGKDDPIASADFEDLVRLVDGREELWAEIAATPVPLRLYLAEHLGQLAQRTDFAEAVEAALPSEAGSQARSQVVVARWHDIVDAT
jgi:predicted nucleotidyltransferase